MRSDAFGVLSPAFLSRSFYAPGNPAPGFLTPIEPPNGQAQFLFYLVLNTDLLKDLSTSDWAMKLKCPNAGECDVVVVKLRGNEVQINVQKIIIEESREFRETSTYRKQSDSNGKHCTFFYTFVDASHTTVQMCTNALGCVTLFSCSCRINHSHISMQTTDTNIVV